MSLYVLVFYFFVLCVSTSDASKRQVYDLLKAKTYSKTTIAGIMGNIDVETGGSYSYTQKQYGGGNGYGLFQFDFLKSYYYDYLSSNSKQDSAASQIDFMHSTIYGENRYIIGYGNAKKVRDAFALNDVDKATTAFCDYFQNPGIPHLDRRKSSARQILNTYIPSIQN